MMEALTQLVDYARALPLQTQLAMIAFLLSVSALLICVVTLIQWRWGR